MYLYLEMVQGYHLEHRANLSGALQCSGICLNNECVVDGNGGYFKKSSERQMIIQSLCRTTIRPETVGPTRRAACMSHSTSDKTTVFYYKSTVLENLGKNVPVVLKISDSNQFLKCQFRNGRAVLEFE
ncbi:interleukin-1 beta-like, partial [Clarias magur]